MACAWSCLAQPYFAAGPCGLSAIWWGRLKLRVSQSSRTTKAHGRSNWASTRLNWVSEQSGTTRDVPPATFTIQDIGAHASALALKEILCLFEISVVMLYCFMWLICKNNSPKKPFPFNLCFLSTKDYAMGTNVIANTTNIILATRTNSNLVLIFIKMLYVYSEKEHCNRK